MKKAMRRKDGIKEEFSATIDPFGLAKKVDLLSRFTKRLQDLLGTSC